MNPRSATHILLRDTLTSKLHLLLRNTQTRHPEAREFKFLTHSRAYFCRTGVRVIPGVHEISE